MNLKIPPRNGRYLLPLWATFLAAVLLAGFYTVMCLWCQPNSLRAVLQVLLAQPKLIVLNALPIGLLILACAFLLRSVFYSAALVGTCCSVLSLANRIKIEVRDEPVFPRDLALLKEVGDAAATYDIQWPWASIAAVVFSAAALVVIGLFVGCRMPELSRAQTIAIRAGGTLAPLAMLTVLIFTVYASDDLYNSFKVSNAYYVPSVFNELGFPYCFCHHFTTYTVERPDGYDRREAEVWDSAETAADQEKNVHVIMVMNEAFSDLTDLEAFTYTEENDPLTHFHALQESENVFSGHIITPSFAGGTANTEFDVLTGMRTQALGSGTTSAMRAVNSNLDSLLRIFSDDGYATSFVHPGNDWFYNRENVYQWLGAEDSVFIDEMSDVEYKGRWVTDEYIASLIKERFADSVSANESVFSYITTIQNHMSYNLSKYGEDYPYPPVDTDIALSDAAEALLSVYIEGVRDADAMLGELAEYFSATDEPVVLVFFGDHLPYLGENQLAYKEIGSEVGMAEALRSNVYAAYETPYIVWANNAAAETLDWDNTVESLELPSDRRISACFLGQVVLELTGRGKSSAWFSYLGEVRRELPVIQLASCITADGTLHSQAGLPDALKAHIDKMDRWSYYKLRQKEIG